MYKYVIVIIILIIVSLSFGKNTETNPSLSYYDIPQNMQLYARDGEDSSYVIFEGKVETEGYDSIYVEVYKNGTSYDRLSNGLCYRIGRALFKLYPKIHAELSEYKFLLYLKNSEGSTLVKTVDSVVCGDVYIIAGQSNGQNPDLNVTINDEYCRTFGVQTDSLNYSNYNLADTLWNRASAMYNDFAILPKGNYSHNVGTLGMYLQKQIRDTCNIPTAIINANHWGTSIRTHLRNNSNPTDPSTYYGKTLYRMQKSKLDTKVKGIIWYQGEVDVNASSSDVNGQNPNGISGYNNYENDFDLLRESWMNDYPSLEKIYVIQVRPLNCAGSSDYAQELREIQRQLEFTYSNVQVVSSLGIGYYQNCHYAYQGYKQLSEIIFKNFQADFYPSTISNTDNIRPPSIKEAFYTNSNNTQIGITFHNSNPTSIPSDTLGINVKKYFYLDKVRTATTVSSLSLSSNKDTLYINLYSSSSATKLAYIPDYQNEYGSVYNGAFIRNNRGLAMLSFDDVFINEFK